MYKLKFLAAHSSAKSLSQATTQEKSQTKTRWTQIEQRVLVVALAPVPQRQQMRAVLPANREERPSAKERASCSNEREDAHCARHHLHSNTSLRRIEMEHHKWLQGREKRFIETRNEHTPIRRARFDNRRTIVVEIQTRSFCQRA